jgi:thiamine biosynthesis protein ThiS
MITVQINGEPREIPEGLNINQLLEHLQANPATTLVEYNRAALFKREWPEKIVADGDEIELVTIVAGG